MATSTQPRKEAAVAYEELAKTVDTDEQVRRFVEEAHPEVAGQSGFRIVCGTDFNIIRRTILVDSDLAEWVNGYCEKRGEDLSSFVRRVLLWRANRILTHGEAPPEEGICPVEATKRTAHVTFSFWPPQYTLVQLAMARWDTSMSQFGAGALYRYRENVEGVG